MSLLRLLCFVIIIATTSVTAYVEQLDDSFKELRKKEPWLVQFYAPWCAFCKTFTPIWYEIGAELKSMGSDVNVGIMDCTAHTSLAAELGIRGYPTIKMFKGEKVYTYNGPRQRPEILEFVHRVSGPAVRALPSVQMFQHAMSHNDILFVYVGGASPLKEKYVTVASELIVYLSFYSALENVLPKAVSLADTPSVVVFKEGTYFIYDEYQHGELKTWVNKERFPIYSKLDSYTLYAMGDSGKLVAIAVENEKNPSKESIHLKTLIETAATEYKDDFSSNYQFGYMEENSYLNGIVMSEVKAPCIIVLNLTNDGFYRPNKSMQGIQDLRTFLHDILDGKIQEQGGNGAVQRVKRTVRDLKEMVTSMYEVSPIGTCCIIGIPLSVVGMLVYATCTVVPVDEDEQEKQGEKKALEDKEKKRKNSGSKKED